MIEAGWIDEVRTLLDAGTDTELPGLATLGYPHVIAHLAGRIDRARLVELVVRDTRRFARSQETWFRKTRDATSIAWNDSRAVDVLARELGAAFPGARP